MRKLNYFLLVISTTSIYGQVGINTQNPETTLEVVGKPNDVNHYDGIIPPRISGNQLSAKTYSSGKKGAIVYATARPSNLSGQVINVSEPAPYYFDGSVWQPFSKEPIEYMVILSFDSNSTKVLQLLQDGLRQLIILRVPMYILRLLKRTPLELKILEV